MDQAVNAGIRVIRTWGFRDLNVTYIPNGVSENYPHSASSQDPS